MRIVLIHPNYHSGGAEIAGNWPPAWVAYLAGPLKAAGFTEVRFIDAMTDHLSDDALRAALAEAKPDLVGCTAITPSIYTAERALQIGLVQEVHPYGRHRERAMEIAREICKCAPLGLRATKEAARVYLDQGEQAAIAAIPAIRKAVFASADFKEGIQSFVERREARFEGR